MFELQSKWIAGILSNRIALPSKEEMVEDIEVFYSSLEATGTPKRYTHNMALLQVASKPFQPVPSILHICFSQEFKETIGLESFPFMVIRN